jgi:hypothetical protein
LTGSCELTSSVIVGAEADDEEFEEEEETLDDEEASFDASLDITLVEGAE